ncbi:GNAT family acetyltransferase [Protomyces lactucae-debilis]|uniref:GNAT family acetyltransferase n=1 Tax=Protomyces lactucae-debilis TaxID=2754530 RepID=A0A1Y2FC01_PROLT|nr:GNAT family acetyltransferase [Protomyces lactucae-debilis]ORY80385.1 GNAT family acetyltransferase [Protomyces lactucae-debilis]
MSYTPPDLKTFAGAFPPTRKPLHGRTVTLQPIQESHFAELYACLDVANFHTSPIWRYVPYEPVDSYADWVKLATQLIHAEPNCYYTVLLNHAKPVGMAALIEVQPKIGNAEVGALLFSPAMQRTTASTETVYLLLKHAFEDLGNRRVAWKCHSENEASKQAAARFGFQAEGVWRNHYLVHGKNRDSAWFSMIDTEWLQRKRAFESWLEPDNFEDGKQKRRLQDV